MAPELISIKSYAEAILAGERKVTLRSDLGDQGLKKWSVWGRPVRKGSWLTWSQCRQRMCRSRGSKAEGDKLQKMLDDARRLLKEMNKKPAARGAKKAKAEPKRSMKKA